MPALFVLAFPDQASGTRDQLGVDYRLYMDVTRRWMDGGPYFEPYQLAGPYEISAGDVLYPPVALLFFVPFTFIPPVVYWVIPAVVVGLGRLRARRATWRGKRATYRNVNRIHRRVTTSSRLRIAWPTTVLKTWTGNPVVWIATAMAVATIWRGAAVLVLLKPSLFPFALFGANRRAWWLSLAALVLVSIPFGSMWADWLTALSNSRGGGLLYSALEIPFVALPLIAWAGRTRDRERIAATPGPAPGTIADAGPDAAAVPS